MIKGELWVSKEGEARNCRFLSDKGEGEERQMVSNGDGGRKREIDTDL